MIHGFLGQQRLHLMQCKAIMWGGILLWLPCVDGRLLLTELGIIGHVFHPNTVYLMGCCIENGLYLVFEFSSNGTLASALHGRNGKLLEWPVRYQIAVRIARGLHCLHKCCRRRIIHRDIKASNVLLGEDFEPQISDFGLAKWLPRQWTHHSVIPIEGKFSALVGLFFPAVTAVMAGSNRSASLKDTQKSIPIGTLAATPTTTCLYVISVLLFGALATIEELLTNRLLTAEVAWPIPAIIYVGIILSTLGAALQSLTGAPCLLAAIANDDILPVLKYFRVTEGSEPHLATLFTTFICIGCVVIGNLDLVTPTITM